MASLLSDGTISSEDRRRLQHHLDDCAHCSIIWEDMQRVDAQVRAGIRVPPSPDFARRLETSIASLRPRRTRRLSLQDKWYGSLAAPFLILCAGLFMTINTLWQHPMLLGRVFIVHLPRFVAYLYRITNSEIVSEWALAIRTLQVQLQVHLDTLTHIPALQSVLVGYLITSFTLGVLGLYLLNRLNLQSPGVASRTS